MIRKRLLSISLIALFITASILSCFGLTTVRAETDRQGVYTARPSVNGRLHVQGTVLADESGREVQFRGVSTHGLTWYPEYIDAGLFE